MHFFLLSDHKKISLHFLQAFLQLEEHRLRLLFLRGETPNPELEVLVFQE